MAEISQHDPAVFRPKTEQKRRLRLPGTSDEQIVWLTFLLAIGLIVQVALVVTNHEPRAATWLLVITMVGIGQALLFPAGVGTLGSLLTVTAWLLFLQATNVWGEQARLGTVLEVTGLSLLLLLALAFRLYRQQEQSELAELRALRQVLVAGEAGTGLFPAEVAVLRLTEEVDRAQTFGRPLGLMLIEIVPREGTEMSPETRAEISRALARQLIAVALVHDLPFRQNDLRLGLIMPERNWEQLYEDAEKVTGGLSRAVYSDTRGLPRPVSGVAQLLFGLGTYNGELSGEVDLMRAAEDSLAVSQDLASMGEPPSSAYAMPAAPAVTISTPGYEEDSE